MVFDAVENDNASVPGFAGLWLAGGGGQGTQVAAFTSVSTGTVTDEGLCSTLASGCNTSQPSVNIITRRRFEMFKPELFKPELFKPAPLYVAGSRQDTDASSVFDGLTAR